MYSKSSCVDSPDPDSEKLIRDNKTGVLCITRLAESATQNSTFCYIESIEPGGIGMIYFKVIDLDRCMLHVAPCSQRSPSLRTGDYLGTFLLKCTLLYCGEWGLGESPGR